MTNSEDLHNGAYLDFVKQFVYNGMIFEISTIQ